MKITLSKRQWEFIGKKTGWTKEAQDATQPGTPIEQLKKIATNPNSTVEELQSVITNPNATPEIINPAKQNPNCPYKYRNIEI